MKKLSEDAAWVAGAYRIGWMKGSTGEAGVRKKTTKDADGDAASAKAWNLGYADGLAAYKHAQKKSMVTARRLTKGA